MIDIPRNELLDKIDAGWKVRRKEWAIGTRISKMNADGKWEEVQW